MNKTLVYLIYFCVYSAALLLVGKSSFLDSNTIGKFYIGDRSLNLAQCMLTFTGTWVSAATILGFTGGVYESGYAALFYSVVPWFVGAFLLIGISGRLYDSDILTIPEFYRKRYDSKALQITYAVIMVGVYIFYLVIQIKGFGLVASNLFGIPYGVSILMVYLFILYATFGGYHAVTRTDAFNLIALSAGLVVVFSIVVGRAGGLGEISRRAVEISGTAHAGMHYPTEQGDLLRLFGKGKFSPWMSVTMFCGWGLGLAANPQYTIRMLSAKNKKTSRNTIICALIFLAFLYYALLEIGLGMRVLFPTLDAVSNTDDIFVYVINNLLYTPLSGFFLFTIIGACISTANSQLLLIASSFAYDIVNTASRKPLEERTLLTLSRVSILVGGTLSLLLSINPPESLLTYGGDIWGIYGITMFPTLYGTLLYKKSTRQGVWACLITGALGIMLFYPFYYNGLLPVHPAFPAVLLSGSAFLLVSRITWGRSMEDAR